MRFLKRFFCCLFAVSVSGGIIYADILSEFPSEIIMHHSEIHNTLLGAGVSIGNIPDGVCASSGSDKVVALKEGEYSASLKVGNIPFKNVRLFVTKPVNLYASGDLIGIRIYNNGLIVTNLAIISSKGNEVSPAQSAGIVPGDIILDINGTVPSESEAVSSLLKKDTTLTIRRGNSIKKIKLTPAIDDNDGKLKLGLLVRDSSAGVGTLTYINPESSTYGALGHGISDSDTGILFDVSRGSIEKSSVVSIEKGKRGTPGQISGSFEGALTVSGTIKKNCEAGIFGEVFPENMLHSQKYPVGVMSQVKAGKAKILCSVEGEIKEYEISILRTMPYGSTSKGLFIEITDPVLLEKTGGIVQGMSGSPIIQDGKLIGAVTHVLVNDPRRGYGIFIENMLAEAEKISD